MMYPEESMMKPEPIARCRPTTTPVFPRSLCSSAPYPVTRICTTLGETFLTRASTEELRLRRDSVSDVDWAATDAEQISEASATESTLRKHLRADGNLGCKLPGRFDIGNLPLNQAHRLMQDSLFSTHSYTASYTVCPFKVSHGTCS